MAVLGRPPPRLRTSHSMSALIACITNIHLNCTNSRARDLARSRHSFRACAPRFSQRMCARHTSSHPQSLNHLIHQPNHARRAHEREQPADRRRTAQAGRGRQVRRVVHPADMRGDHFYSCGMSKIYSDFIPSTCIRYFAVFPIAASPQRRARHPDTAPMPSTSVAVMITRQVSVGPPRIAHRMRKCS